jgi:membrane-bound ClpP family serine protease
MQLGRQLFGVGRSVAEWNLELTPARRVAKWITRPISRVGAFAARFLLGGWKDRALAVAAAALLVIGAVALVVTGFLSWPGRVALIAIVLGIAGIVWLSRPIRAKGASPPPSAA